MIPKCHFTPNKKKQHIFSLVSCGIVVLIVLSVVVSEISVCGGFLVDKTWVRWGGSNEKYYQVALWEVEGPMFLFYTSNTPYMSHILHYIIILEIHNKDFFQPILITDNDLLLTAVTN